MPSGPWLKVDNHEIYRHRRLDRCGLSACFGWLGEQPEVLRQGSERGHSVHELHSHRPDFAAAFDRLLDVEAVKSAVRVLGYLVGRQQIPLAVKQGAGIEER